MCTAYTHAGGVYRRVPRIRQIYVRAYRISGVYALKYPTFITIYAIWRIYTVYPSDYIYAIASPSGRYLAVFMTVCQLDMFKLYNVIDACAMEKFVNIWRFSCQPGGSWRLR